MGTRTAFLFTRWDPSRWYFGPILMARNLIFVTVVVMFTDNGAMQLSTTGMACLIYLIFQATLQPWKAVGLNRVDSVLSMGLVGLCIFSGPFAEYSDEKAANALT